jgi:hypothetical protein
MESNHIGTPPARFNCWESKMFYVHNFLELSDEESNDNVENAKEVVESESFTRLYESMPLLREILAFYFERSNKRQRVR